MGLRHEAELKKLLETKRPEHTGGVGLPPSGVWVWGVAGRGLPANCELPRAVYMLLRGHGQVIPPRERGDSPLRCYTTEADATQALRKAVALYEAALTE